MSEMSVRLRKIADELASGRCRQTTGAPVRPDGTVCAEGCAHRAVLGLAEGEFFAFWVGPMTAVGARMSEAWGPEWSEVTASFKKVAEKVCTYTGLQPANVSIPTLNDSFGVPFETFARAFRAVALEMEEQEYGEAISPAEAREVAEVGA